MKSILFEGVVPPVLKEICNLGFYRLFRSTYFLVVTLQNPLKLLKLRNVWNQNYSWEVNMTLKCILDYEKFRKLNLESEDIKYFSGDSLGTITAAIAAQTIAPMKGFKIAKVIGKIQDRITDYKPDLMSIVYATGRDGNNLENEAHFTDLLKQSEVVLGVRLASGLGVIIGPSENIEHAIQTKPEYIFIKVLGRNKVTHYPTFTEYITEKDRTTVAELAKNFIPQREYISNRVETNHSQIKTQADLIAEVLGCIDKVISVQNVLAKMDKPVQSIGTNGYLEEILTSN